MQHRPAPFPHAARALTLLVLAAPALAQEGAPPMSAEEKAAMEAYMKAATPGPEHAALAKMAGDYALKIRSWTKPGSPPFESTGTAVRRMILGERVMVEDVTATMMGQPFTGIGMHGYDNVSGRHWATWNDNMGTGLMVSEGQCDAQGACTFAGSWYDPMAKGKVTARMTTRWTAPGTELFEMHGPGPDGKEMKMMEITYTRQP